LVPDWPQGSHAPSIGAEDGNLEKCLIEGWFPEVVRTTIGAGQLRRPLQPVEEERRMSSTIVESLNHTDSLLEVEYDVSRRDVERAELARDVEAQHERLHTLRAIVLEELTKQRRVTMPRWPSGPKVVAPTLVDEDEWWNKMLGRKKAA
jgi:hypothetical protein